MERIHRWINEPFHPLTGRHAGASKWFAVFAAFSFNSYFVLGALRRMSEEDYGCYTGMNDWIWVMLGYAVVASVGVLIAPAVRWRRAKRGTDGELQSPETTLLGVFGQGLLSLVLFVSILAGLQALDKKAKKLGPPTYNQTGIRMADRVLDAAAIASCALSPSAKCRVLVRADFVPLRTWMATRACRSRAVGTHRLCAIALEDGAMHRYEVCQLDAQAPHYERICSVSERNRHRRALGLPVHGER